MILLDPVTRDIVFFSLGALVTALNKKMNRCFVARKTEVELDGDYKTKKWVKHPYLMGCLLK
jgi:hypothetical protein